MKKIFFAFLLLACLPALAQRQMERTAQFTISGWVSHPLTVTIAEIKALPQMPIGDITIRNQKGEEKRTVKDARGVLLKQFIEKAAVNAGDKPKELNAVYFVLTASDGYINVYSWNELFNNDLGNHVYIVTSEDGKSADDMDDSILVVSSTDTNPGRRHLKCLSKIDVKKAQ